MDMYTVRYAKSQTGYPSDEAWREQGVAATPEEVFELQRDAMRAGADYIRIINCEGQEYGWLVWPGSLPAAEREQAYRKYFIRLDDDMP